MVLAGGEAKTTKFVNAIESGQYAFALGLNNIFELTFDDACFTAAFNKQIRQDSFEHSDSVLDGGETNYSFVLDSPTQWTVRINGMTLFGTFRLLLNKESLNVLSCLSFRKGS